MVHEEIEQELYTSYLEKELRLDAQGCWFHDGVRFTHKKLSSFFHRSIFYDKELESYVLLIGKGRATFKHDGFVRFVFRIDEEDNGELVVQLLCGSQVALDPGNLLISTVDDVFLLKLPSLEIARFTRPAQQAILEYAESERTLVVNGRSHLIPFYEDE